MVGGVKAYYAVLLALVLGVGWDSLGYDNKHHDANRVN